MGSKELSPALQQWLVGLALSHPLRSVRVQLSNGYLVAELLSKYYPADVQMLAFGNYGSLDKKKANWWLLQKLFKKGEIPIKEKLVKRVIDAEEGAAVKLLTILHDYLEGGGAGPQSTEAADKATAVSSVGAGSEPQPLPWAVPGQSAGPAEGPAQAAAAAAAKPVLGATAASPCLAGGTTSIVGQQRPILAAVDPSLAAHGYLGGNASMVLGGAALPAPQQQEPQQLGYVEAAAAAAAAAAAGVYAQQSSTSMGWNTMPIAVPIQELPYYSATDAVEAFPDASARMLYDGEQFLQQAYMPIPPVSMPPANAAALCGLGWEGWQAPYIGCPQQPAGLPPGAVLAPHQLAGLQLQPAGGAGGATGQSPKKQQHKQRGRQQQRRQQQPAQPVILPPLSGPTAGQLATVPPPPAETPAVAGRLVGVGAAAAAAPSEVASLPAAEPQQPRIEYDKRPRPVAWVPHSYKEYQLREYDVKQAKAYWELGKLGPDCYESAEWRQKWEKLERQKAFGQAARAVNLQKAAENPSVPVPKKKPPSSREKAVEFAKRLEASKPLPRSEASLSPRPQQAGKVQLRELAAKDREGLANMIRRELARASLQGQEG